MAAREWPETQSLPSHAGLWARQSSVRLIGGFLVATLVLRGFMGRWSPADLIGPALVVAFEPFTEWLLHVHLLHRQPKKIGRVTVDPLAARKHRAHHADPRALELVLVPTAVLVLGLPIAAALVVLVSRAEPAAITGLAAGYAMFLTYEWTHFLIHSKYKPRHAYYRLLWRHHRNHHFRNEHYWFGVTTDLGDRLLGTRPERDAVAVSPTARNLAAGWE